VPIADCCACYSAPLTPGVLPCAANIADIEKVETVFKDGIGYDSAKLINSVRGLVGLR